MKVQIHQMLHGYNQGHNLIQGSIMLPSSKDMDCMAILSDWSEYTNTLDEADYITIYPLENSGYYVIAKTWYANEMKRPGCVWTHSFLIPFCQLVQIVDFRVFIELFVRPKDNIFDSYAVPIQIETTAEYDKPLFSNKHIIIPSLSIIYNELINQHPLVFCIENESIFYQNLCLLLLNYFPYQLLCQLSFSTGSSRIRTFNNRPFSLQFINTQNEFTKSIISYDEMEIEAIPSWIKMATENIALENLQLTRLFHTFADEIADNFKNLNGFLVLIELINKRYETIEEKQNALKLIIAELATLFPNSDEGQILKERFLQQQITIKFIPDYEFIYEMCISEFSNSFLQQSIHFQERFIIVAQNDNRQFYYLLLQKLCQTSHLNAWGENILARSNENLNVSDLNYIAETDWSLFQSLVSICPELLNQCSWTTYSNHQIEDILSIIISRASNVFTEWKTLLVKILEMQVDIHIDLCSLIFQKDKKAINYVLDYLNASPDNSVSKSIEILSQHESSKILTWMGMVNELTPNVGFLIMQSIRPISKQVQSEGVKRWLAFSMLSVESIEYFTYLYLLSFNWPSDAYAIKFMRKAFYPIHKVASEGRLDYELWRNISPYTENLPIWHDWDRCKKLRKTVVKRIKRASLPKSFIRDFTPDKELNKELVRIWEK
ncbi:MAG: hypothetical protein PHR13_11375 [Dysgonamonadaceae bacterium]|nr:hypothetical protein [Dysgonamonadaceae bacterium]MDD3901679.1 hypothetical protein [Dysgonamonadaceae bacterium]